MNKGTAAQNSYRAILRSTSIIGASSVLNVGFGLMRMKAAAILLGPAGVGLVGMYQNLIQTGSTVSALGLGTAGTRQIAAAHGQGDAVAVERARRALMWGTVGLAILGGLFFYLLSGWIAVRVLAAPVRAGQVAWLSLGVTLTVAAGSQLALLTGLRRIGALARVQVISAVASALVGIAAIWLWGSSGLLTMVLIAPLSTFVMGHWFVSKLPHANAPPTSLAMLSDQWRAMAGIGTAFMLSGIVTTLGQLTVRTLVQHNLGAEALGQFQASWTIGMTYLGFVLGAMSTDYYPRLTSVIQDKTAAMRIVNEQTEVALLLCAPIVLTMLALTPLVIQLLYSSRFAPAAAILRWQLLGDILKVMSWPLGFILLAAGAGKTFIFTEASATGALVLTSGLLLPVIGITGTGIAFVAMYVCYLPLVYLLARQRIGFRWTPAVISQAVALMVAAIVVHFAGGISSSLAAFIGVLLATAFGIYGLGRLGHMASFEGKVGRLAQISRRIVMGIGIPL